MCIELNKYIKYKKKNESREDYKYYHILQYIQQCTIKLNHKPNESY